ncbi:MAG: APC family permease [Candidatus Micrarchaeaceae archaeon]
MAKDGKNKVSVLAATAVGLGAIIGAGIFVLSGTAIAIAGADALIAFVIVGILATIVALEFGELGTIFPHLEGASYSYVREAFGSELGFITGIIMYFSFATSISVVALGFGSYLSSMLGMTQGIIAILFAIMLIAVLSLISILGVKKAVRTDLGLVIIKVLVLLFFIAFAIFIAVSQHLISLGNFSVSIAQGSFSSLLSASIVIFFAYTGFQTIMTLTPKIRGGGMGAAKATLFAVVISMVLYIAIVVSLLMLVPASQFTISADPLALALGHVHAPSWLLTVVDIGALVATASATLAMIVGGSRLMYQISSDGLLPRIFRKYNKSKDVAESTVIASALIGTVMLFSGNIFVITAISNFGVLFAYLMVSLAVIHFRRKGVTAGFKVPFYPYLPIASAIMILMFMLGMPSEALVIGVIMIMALIVIYYSLREAEDKKIIKIRLFK